MAHTCATLFCPAFILFVRCPWVWCKYMWYHTMLVFEHAFRYTDAEHCRRALLELRRRFYDGVRCASSLVPHLPSFESKHGSHVHYEAIGCVIICRMRGRGQHLRPIVG
uniref:Uncharacterized protein n=1 Tax=Craspedostauros australis TaxID=1486917 RepID=A0A7R9ZPR6_9STRA